MVKTPAVNPRSRYPGSIPGAAPKHNKLSSESEVMELKKGLIIKREHCENILKGLKTLEMRGNRTNFRGEFGLIISGTKNIFGTAELVGVMDHKILTKETWHAHFELHRCEEYMPKWPWGWILKNIVRFDKPIPYAHKNGQVNWVNFTEEAD